VLETDSRRARLIARAAMAFEHRQTGHMPESATVVLTADTLVVTLHGALTPAEKALAQTRAGAAQVREFHRELFASSSESLRREIARITGVAVREEIEDVETAPGVVVQVLTSGAVVQVFLLEQSLPTEIWSGGGPLDSR